MEGKQELLKDLQKNVNIKQLKWILKHLLYITLLILSIKHNATQNAVTERKIICQRTLDTLLETYDTAIKRTKGFWVIHMMTHDFNFNFNCMTNR